MPGTVSLPWVCGQCGHLGKSKLCWLGGQHGAARQEASSVYIHLALTFLNGKVAARLSTTSDSDEPQLISKGLAGKK